MPVAQARRDIDSREFAEWIAYANVEPFGEQREDFRMGYIAAIICNMFLPRGSRRLTPRDFMPDFSPPKPQTGAEMWARLTMIGDLQNARVEKGKA